MDDVLYYIISIQRKIVTIPTERKPLKFISITLRQINKYILYKENFMGWIMW